MAGQLRSAAFLVRTFVMTAAALVAAVVLYVLFTLPPRAVVFDAALPPTVVYGAYHVHTTRSDGTSSPDEVALAAARAGLSFVIFTDHGDATRQPDPPTYRHGVLCLDAVEISSDQGHIVAIGLGGASPYPLGGAARDVAEDVHRQGGWVVLAHPDSPREELRWTGRDVPMDGIEWLNADSEWRDEAPRHLLMTAARSLFRAPEAVASLFSRPARTLRRWDTAAARRSTIGLAAIDAHSRWPGYDRLFRVLAQAVVLEAPLGGDAGVDGAAVLDALARAHTFSIIRALAGPAVLEWRATTGVREFTAGDRLPAGEAVTFQARVPQAPGVVIRLLRDGVEVATGRGSLVRTGPAAPGAYRVEADYPTATVPWIVSNPIYVGEPVVPPPAAPLADVPLLPLDAADWRLEHDAASTGTVTVEDGWRRFGYALGRGVPAGQYAALVTDTPPETGFDRIRFTARADRPMRVSVQVRLPGGPDGQRWRRSVYLDATPRTLVVPLEDLEPVGMDSTQRPVVARINSLLFVVDTVNTSTGAEGTVWIRDAALGVGTPGG
ncbi:MAG: CehA/McbA family metallohydrolase [Vicinamibacterales bacterium]